MKFIRKYSLHIIIICLLLLLAGCGTTTITEHEGNYIYSANEEINVIDIGTRDKIGTLKIIDAEILLNEPFAIKEYSGKDEEGNTIYKDVEHSQLIQVNYQYKSNNGKKISSSNFSVEDSINKNAKISPDMEIEYNIHIKKDSDYFIVALKNKSSFLNINFNYNLFQTTATAKAKIDITTNTSQNSNPPVDFEESESPSLEPPDTSLSSFLLYPQSKILIFISIILFIAVVALTVVVVIMITRRK